MDENPYAAPAPDPQPVFDLLPTGRVWREGKFVVLEHGARLPERCIYCNSDARIKMIRSKLTYRPFWPWQATYKAVVDMGVCQRCRRKRFAIWLTVFACAVSALTVDFVLKSGWTFLFGFLALPLILVIQHFYQHPYAAKIDRWLIRLPGLSRPFLESLPSTDGADTTGALGN